MKYNAILFDLDGTLLNTLDDLADSCNFALAQCGFPQRDIEEVRRFVGNGVGKLIGRAVPGGTTPEDFDRCLKLFKEHYAHNMQNKTAPYPGVVDMLNRLNGQGYKLGIVSNKFDAAVKALCAHHFPAVPVAIGESDTVAPKPAPDGINTALTDLDAPIGRALFVGDSEVDVQTAQNAGIEFLAVDWGFRTQAALIEAGATQVVSSAEELIDWLSAQN